jgi:hypothetical protein
MATVPAHCGLATGRQQGLATSEFGGQFVCRNIRKLTVTCLAVQIS